MSSDVVRTSKFLSVVLRHKPESIGLRLDAQGWASIADLVDASARSGRPLSRELIAEVVATSDKQRFALSPDGQRIRANQGHSLDVELGLAPAVPPAILYHGTADRFLASIGARGLHAGSRQHVHLSRDEPTAMKVGSRHGRPVVLTVRAGSMHAAGHAFFLSDNGVWLTDAVPPQFIVFPEDNSP